MKMQWFLLFFFFCSFLAQGQQEQKKLFKAVEEYYRQFLMFSEQASRKHTLEEAHKFFYDTIKNLDFYLKKHGIENIPQDVQKNIRMGYQNKPYRCFFYPAWIYDKRDGILVSLDKKKMEGLIQRILTKEAELSLEIDQKIELQEKEKKEKRMYENLKREQIGMEKEILQGKRKIEENKGENQRLELEIQKRQSQSILYQRKSDEIWMQVTRLRRLLASENDPFKRERWQRQLRGLEWERQEYENKGIAFQNQLREMERKYRKNQEEIENLISNMYGWEEKENRLKEQILKLEEEIQQMEDSLLVIEKKLEPLMLLISEKQQKEALLQKVSVWWRRANRKPRRNFLQAFYVLENFPKKYYRVKVKKSYALEGIVEVYFW